MAKIKQPLPEIVNNFRVNELHLLLTSYHYPKLGKKQDLVNRALSILANPKYQLSAVQKVREIQANNRIRNTSQPYPTGNQVNIPPLHQQQVNPGMHNNPYMPGGMNTRNMYNGYAYPGHPAAPYQPPYGQQYPGPSSSLLGGPQQGHHHQGYGHGGGGSSAVSMATNQVRNLKIVDLPFFDKIETIVNLTELPGFSGQVRPGDARMQCHFFIPPEHSSKLYYKTNDQPLPRYEIQLRMFQLETGTEQQDAFPPNCTVKLDDFNVSLPNIIPTNKPNAEQKRLSRPVDLTPFCQPPRGRERPHRLYFEWSGDKRAWAFGVYIVHRLTSQILLDRILQNPNSKRQFENTKNTIVRRLGVGDDDGIQMDTLKISLVDPLMRTRIRIPSRPIECTHLQCFDLNNYLMMNEKRPVWKCPVCDNQAIYSKLIIDQYYERLLTSVGTSVEEVELLKDGMWRVVKEEAFSLSSGEDDDDIVELPTTKGVSMRRPDQQDGGGSTASGGSRSANDSTPAPQAAREPAPSPAVRNTAAVSDDDIICLSSDDEDDYFAPPAPQQQQPQRTVDTQARGISSDSPKTPAAAAVTASSTPAMGTPQRSVSSPSMHNNSSSNNGRNSTSGSGGTLHLQSSSSDSMTPGAAAPGSAPVLQTNGFHPAVFRPIMDEVSKTQVAQNLANFLQNVCSKNSSSSNQI